MVGFLVLAASGFVLAATASKESALWLIPGLLLQGIGLGVVLTVNDPTGLNSVSQEDQGLAAGMINTSEQLGGAIGIAALAALEVSYYKHQLFARLHDHGFFPTQQQINDFTDFAQRAEQHGLHHVQPTVAHVPTHDVKVVIAQSVQAHVEAFQIMFVVSAAIAVAGAIACLLLVRRTDRVTEGPIFSRRSRWVSANVGRTPAVTRHPPPSVPETPDAG